jgi:hypothetical protein
MYPSLIGPPYYKEPWSVVLPDQFMAFTMSPNRSIGLDPQDIEGTL